MIPPKARLIVVVLAGASAALGQRVVSAKAGLVSFVQGRASVEGGPLKAGESYRQLKDGESLSTDRGRAELLLNPGIFLRLGDMGRLRMDNSKLTDACVSLESGSAVVSVNYILKVDHVRLISGGSVIVMKQTGVYRLDVAQGRLRVFSGQAEVQRDGSPLKKVVVKHGQTVDLDDSLKIAQFDVKETDALQKWVTSRSRTPLSRGFGLRPQPPHMGWQNNELPPDPGGHGGASTSSNQF
jgi:hypothetical protein